MFTETSAKVGINVKQLFKDLAATLPGVDQSRSAANDPQAEARGAGGGTDGADAGTNKPAFNLGGSSGAQQAKKAQQEAGKTNGGSKCC